MEKGGAPQIYSDTAIESLSILRFRFGLSCKAEDILRTLRLALKLNRIKGKVVSAGSFLKPILLNTDRPVVVEIRDILNLLLRIMREVPAPKAYLPVNNSNECRYPKVQSVN